MTSPETIDITTTLTELPSTITIVQQLEDLAARAERVASSDTPDHALYQEALALGVNARTHGDLSRLVLGSAVCSLERAYGKSVVSQYATDIGVGEQGASSLYGYARWVGRLGILTCVQYLAAGVSYSKQRAALSLKDPALIMERIEKANGLRDLEPGETLTLGDPDRPKLLVDLRDAVVVAIDPTTGTMTIRPADPKHLTAFEVGGVYRLRTYKEE